MTSLWLSAACEWNGMYLFVCVDFLWMLNVSDALVSRLIKISSMAMVPAASSSLVYFISGYMLLIYAKNSVIWSLRMVVIVLYFF